MFTRAPPPNMPTPLFLFEVESSVRYGARYVSGSFHFQEMELINPFAKKKSWEGMGEKLRFRPPSLCLKRLLITISRDGKCEARGVTPLKLIQNFPSCDLPLPSLSVRKLITSPSPTCVFRDQGVQKKPKIEFGRNISPLEGCAYLLSVRRATVSVNEVTRRSNRHVVHSPFSLWTLGPLLSGTGRDVHPEDSSVQKKAK
ncbi:hypothetical protein TNCV_2206691 [Trichonephila clavipes]|uniref:Uncharacterized protein n=1 Tax=Trichonephila clavipes TaxID=2585209 RepID=A0A8X6SDX2_TRICX|nr:hypothetical protein TNCV_2206691 [Trichonephila clavipes]